MRHIVTEWIVVAILLVEAGAQAAAGTLRLPITRDTWFSEVGQEADCNLGGADRLKLKSIQEMSLVDFDPAPLRGRVVRSAVLCVRDRGEEMLRRVTVGSFGAEWVEGTSASYAPQEGSSTFHARRHPDTPWAYPGSDLTAVILGQGGTLWRMADASPPDAGGWQRIPVDPAVVAARVAGVSHGLFLFDDTGSEWSRQGEEVTLRPMPNRFVYSRHAGAENAPFLEVELGPEDREPPEQPGGLAARTAGCRAGEAEVSWVTPRDRGPAGVIGFLVEVDGKPAPRYLIPPAAAAGGRVSMRLGDLLGATTGSSSSAPGATAGSPGATAGLPSSAPGATAGLPSSVGGTVGQANRGTPMRLSVRAVDGAGNASPPANLTVTVAPASAWTLPGPRPKQAEPSGPLPTLGRAKVAVLDALDKVQPDTGRMIPPQPPEYLLANHLWDAGKRQIRLAAARNEFVAFQVLFDGPVGSPRASLEFDGSEQGIEATFAEYRAVPSESGSLPDPLVPLGAVRASGSSTRLDYGVPRLACPTVPSALLDEPAVAPNLPTEECQTTGPPAEEPPARRCLYVELFVPREIAAGAHRGKLVLGDGGQSLTLDVLVWVWKFTLPDHLSFLPEMNCYGLPANERDYYRLAHRHRTVLNRVPYSHAGRVAEGCAPAWNGRELDWAAWDRRFGSYLDGSAFADLPRRGVPVECFYLPLHENWPSPMEGNYNESYWADVAFSEAYRRTFVEVVRQTTEHFKERGWSDTLFQFYLNNKCDYKRNGWSRATSPWLLDEPANFQDYWALRWFGEAFHEGVRQAASAGSGATAGLSSSAEGTVGQANLGAAGGPRMVFRCDISRPQWQRDTLDHVLDYNVVGGGPFRRYHRMVMDRKQAFGQIVLDYGTTNTLESSNVQPVGWCLDSWTLGSDGVVPWQTIGNEQSWRKADPLALFYPGEPVGLVGPVPSARLKAYCRGQQDVEYLALLADAIRVPRGAVAEAVRGELHLAAEHRGTGFVGGEDAGTVHYAKLLPQDVWALRVRVARAIDAAAPAPRPRLVDWRTPARNPAAAPPAYVAGWVPLAARQPVPSGRGSAEMALADKRPVAPAAGPPRILQGREAVRDTVIDPAQPDRNLGREARDNRLVRADLCNAMLLWFDLPKAGLPAGATVARAELVIHVWDPSAHGRTKLRAFELRTPWKETEATWSRPAEGAAWKGGAAFALRVDAGGPLAEVIVEPDQGGDLADPPVEYRLDVTELVRAWLEGKTPNHGLALAPVIDRAVDDGHHTRMQILASESQPAKYGPKLEIRLTR